MVNDALLEKYGNKSNFSVFFSYELVLNFYNKVNILKALYETIKILGVQSSTLSLNFINSFTTK